ncbi:unnamed protein product, partial [Candidula unifasciata]
MNNKSEITNCGRTDSVRLPGNALDTSEQGIRLMGKTNHRADILEQSISNSTATTAATIILGDKTGDSNNCNSNNSSIRCNSSDLQTPGLRSEAQCFPHGDADKSAAIVARDEKPELAVSASTSESTLTPDGTGQDEVTFCDPRQNQVFQVLSGVQQLRRSGQFADLTVKVRDQEFRCHRFVLAANSPFLRSMIEDHKQTRGEMEQERLKLNDGGDSNSAEMNDNNNSNNNNCSNNNSNNNNCNNSNDNISHMCPGNSGTAMSSDSSSSDIIVLRGIQPEVFSKILDFMYCVFDEVLNEDNALDMLLAADTFQLTYLRRTCASFITEALSVKNVFDVIRLCDSGCAHLFEPKVLRRSRQVIRENFTQLSSTDEFLTLNRHHMILLTADSMLCADNEMDVIQALLRWVKVRPEERSADLTLMLQHIRFPLMTSRELDALKEIPLLRENCLAMALIEESRAYGNMDYTDRMAWPRHNAISRCLFPARDFILWTADRDKGLHFYSIIDGLHHKITSFGELTAPTSSGFLFDSTSSVCCYGDSIYFT